MSKIEKLSIQGIRSFGVNHPETLAFNSPLTLIVGFNGSGKTSIIECLRYITTGELPPNSKGGAFIHDPDLTGEKEVMAQVKLRLRSTNGESYVVTRNLSLTVKRTAKGITRSQSTKECSFVLTHQNERTMKTHRVVDIDQKVPATLGVSPAVLEAVIFCHQDESLWPMSEPSALKKKFDEIFEAQRYTKAIDQLKIIRKTQGVSLQKYKDQQAAYKQDKERGQKNERLRKKLEQDIAKLGEDFKEISAEMEIVHAQATAKRKQSNSHLSIVESLKTKSDQFQYKKEAAHQLKNRIDELSEPPHALEKALEEYEQQLARIADERDQKVKEHKELEATLQKTRKEYNAKASEKGKHESDKEKYERQVENRKKMIREAAERHEIRGFDGELDNTLVESFNTRIRKLLADKRQELDRVQRDNADDVEKAANKINELVSKRTSLMQTRSSAKTRISANDKQVASLLNKLKSSSLDVDEGHTSILESELRDLETKLEQAKANDRDSDLDKQIKDTNEKLDRLEFESNKLSQDLVECSKFNEDTAKLKLRKDELEERQRTFDSVIHTQKERLSLVLGSQWKPETVESDYNTVFTQHRSAVNDARNRKDSTENQFSQLKYKLSTARERQRKLAAEKERCKDVVVEALKTSKNEDSALVEDYQAELAGIQSELQTTEQDLSLENELKTFYLKVQTTANRSNKCHLCERDFKGDATSKSKLLVKIAKRMSDEAKEEMLAIKKEYEGKLATLRGVQAQYDTYKRLAVELPPLEEEIRTLDSQEEALDQVLEEKDQEVKQAEEGLADIESLQKHVVKIKDLAKEINISQEQIDRMISQQSSFADTRNSEDLREQQEKINGQMKSVKGHLQKLTADRQRLRDSIGNLEVQRGDKRHELSVASQKLQQKGSLQEQVQQKKNETAAERQAIQAANDEIESLEPLINEAKVLRDEKKSQGRTREQKVASECDKVATSVNELKLLEAEIQDYIDRGGPEKLASNIRAIARLEQDIVNLETDLRKLAVQINELREKIDNGDRKKENIRDNLQLLNLQSDLSKLKEEIAQLESRNAQEDYNRLIAEVKSLDNKHVVLHAKRERASGELSANQRELDRLTEEFEQEYAGAKAKYREAHIKVVTTAAAIEDLMDYGVAMDKAVMQYHTMKMDHINRTVAELWQSTYQGTDIDTILIRSEADTASSTKKSYNYRVCMVKGDTEMDMRGRCSAGQKMLASIIIRLALAESFGASCGLIALDEPTTNLDSDNIRSLAESLHKIIKLRSAQANFQLIVITHDAEFLKYMQCSEFCDTFFRVKRDEHQNSVIVRENITSL